MNISEFTNKYGVLCDEMKSGQFDQYYDLLVETNKVMNLTAITEFPEVLEKHFLDSAAVIPFVDLKQMKSLIDVGTGAGFPGVPLKILFPHLEVVLVDSLQKRVNFLNEVIRTLGLTGIRAVHGRAEEIGRDPEFRDQFDVCVSRAVARLNLLSELCLPMVKSGGLFVPYKSGSADEEIVEAKYAVGILGGKIERVEKIVIGENKIERSFPVIRKVKKTPDRFPRRPGVPGKKPLITKNVEKSVENVKK